MKLEYQINNMNDNWDAHLIAWRVYDIVKERPVVTLSQTELVLIFIKDVSDELKRQIKAIIDDESINKIPQYKHKFSFLWDVDNINKLIGKRVIFHGTPTDNGVLHSLYVMEDMSPQEIEEVINKLKWSSS